VFSAAPEKAIIGSYIGQRPLRVGMSNSQSSSLSKVTVLRPSPINQIFTNNFFWFRNLIIRSRDWWLIVLAGGSLY